MKAQVQAATVRLVPIDREYLEKLLLRLLEIPSPTGYTDNIVHAVVEELEQLGLSCELTRRGAVRATLRGRQRHGKRAIVAHLDTTGAMVTRLKENGRVSLAPIGHWSARFAEGARCTVFTDQGTRRGTILPLKASGHTYGDEIDTQGVGWDHVELRIDEPCKSLDDLLALPVAVGDYVAVDSRPEVTPSGYVVARHLDDKAGVALLLSLVKALGDAGIEPAVDTNVLLTISEEVGSGASAVLHGDVASMVAIDNATPAPNQGSIERGVTIAMMDSSGPFDYHLTRLLLQLCRDLGIPHARDVFRHYRCDVAAAVEAGNDIRTALVCFGVDASHGHERTHLDSLVATAELLASYVQAPPSIARDRYEIAPIRDFPTQPDEEAPPVPVISDLPDATDAPSPPDTTPSPG
jgi:peptidase M42 family hydrolase